MCLSHFHKNSVCLIFTTQCVCLILTRQSVPLKKSNCVEPSVMYDSQGFFFTRIDPGCQKPLCFKNVNLPLIREISLKERDRIASKRSNFSLVYHKKLQYNRILQNRARYKHLCICKPSVKVTQDQVQVQVQVHKNIVTLHRSDISHNLWLQKDFFSNYM